MKSSKEVNCPYCLPVKVVRNGLEVEIKPMQKRYSKVQIDELWSYVGKKKRKYG